MSSFHCPHCQAFFELDDASFPPGTVFDCGACGTEISVPKVLKPRASDPQPAPKVIQPRAAAPAKTSEDAAITRSPKPLPTLKPRAPAEPTAEVEAPAEKLPRKSAAPPRGAGAEKGGSPARRASSSAAAKSATRTPAAKGPDRRILIFGGAGLVVVAVVLIAALSGGGGGAGGGARETSGAGQSSGAAQESAKPTDPYEEAWEAARRSKSIKDLLALGEMAFLRERAAEGEEKATHEQRMRFAYTQVLQQDPANPIAHERLGHFLLDEAEIKRWIADESLPADLRRDVDRDYGFAVDEGLFRDGPRRWLAGKKRTDLETQAKWNRLKDRVAEATAKAKARAGDPFYAEAERAAAQTLRLLDGNGGNFLRKGVTGDAFHVHIEKPYVVVLQRDAGRGRDELVAIEWMRFLQDLDRSFNESYAKVLPAPRRVEPRVVVLLFNSGDYAKYLRREDPTAPILSSAHYEPFTKRIFTPIEPSPDEARSVLFHEGTHQIVDIYMETMPAERYRMAGMRQALWFSEGIAEYFGAHSLAGFDQDGRRQYSFGSILVDRLDAIDSARKAGDAMSVQELVDYSRMRYQQDLGNTTKARKIGIAYSMGWALCYVLQQWKHDTYAEGFQKYFKAEMEGRSGKEAFEAAFGPGSIERVQKDMDEMLDAILKAHAENRIVNGRVIER